jgi:hypothetical protein
VIADNPTIKGRYAKQNIDGEDDALLCDLSTFMRYASKGVPQFLEAMWSQQATTDEITDLRSSFHPDLYETERTYVRTIRNFWEKPGFKFKRHAVRLTLNLLDLREYGSFNPTLDEEHKEKLIEMLESENEPLNYL